MLSAHPYANLFPLISGADLEEFAKNIAEHGVQNPIVVLDGQILDGRNRYAAAQKAGVPCPQVEYTGTDPLGYVIASNLHRRHLTTSQRAAIAAELANMEHGGQGGHVKGSNDPLTDQPAMTIDQAANALNVSPKSVKRAKAIMKADPAAHEAAKAGTKTKEKKVKKNVYGGYQSVFIEAGLLSAVSGPTERNKIREKFSESFGAPYPTGQERNEETDRRIAVAFAFAKAAMPRRAATATEDAPDVKASLSLTAQEKLDRAVSIAVNAELSKLRAEFVEAVNTKVAEERAAIEKQKKEVDEWERKARQEYDAALQIRLGIDSHMTQEEFRLILNCLHPDRAPEDRKERFSKAFLIFNRLEKTVNTKLPLSTLRERGWEKVSPRFKG